MKRIPSFLAVAAAVCAPAAENPSVAGQWKLHSSISGYESDLDCTFTQTGKELGGACKSEQGSHPITGKLEENKVTFQYKAEYQGDQLTVVHAGTFESPNKIVGTVDVQPIGASGEFTATQPK